MRKILASLFPCWLFLYSVYSYSQTDPNLVLSSRPWFWQFQQYMWQLGFHNRPLSAFIFAVLILLLFISYSQIIRSELTRKQVVRLFIVSLIALLPAYPALSHDIFNYLFNAKIVVQYQANPHIQVALDFPDDPWLSFMHNVHTPAPYGYGWTAFSVIPYWLGRGYLQGELLIFRLTMVAALIGCLWILKTLFHVPLRRLVLLAFNPLILIEMIGTIHNDLIMMAPALLAIWCFQKGVGRKKWYWWVIGLGCLGISVSIKYASVALLGAAVAAWVIKRLSVYQWSVLSLWSPLLTNQSQRFLPWYLSWSLVFLPLVNNPRWEKIMIATSFAGLLSYVFILWYGEYSATLLQYRSLFLFGLPLLYWIYLWIRERKVTL